jgi:hypothetical protein
MDENPIRLYKPPRPTRADPFAQINWIFFQLEAEYEGASAKRFSYARIKYLEFVKETNAHYPEMESDARFYLNLYWESDALNRFTKWLVTQNLKSKSRYGVYKSVRQVMNMAYALRVIDSVVYDAPVTKGVNETKQRSAYTDAEQTVINAALARWISLANSVLNGYRPTGQGIPHRPHRYEFGPLNIGGRQYTASEAATEFGVAYPTLSERLRTGWTPEQAVGLIQPPSYPGSIEFTVEDVTYDSISAASRAYGVDSALASKRLRLGLTPEQCVGLAPIHVSRKDERALLWMFENRFGCDALAMYEYVYGRGLHRNGGLCTLKQLASLFIRWGVWPYVDDRIVMPLAAELGMLTGLNVEALKELEIDSYQSAHVLTGQPVILYRKRRSASSTRPEERELHTRLLEVEEHFINDSVVQRVEKVIGLTLALTARIRQDAPPEVARKLFIFEYVERSWNEGSRVVVQMDPRGKAGNWYGRFIADEGLRQIFGDDFSFNISRRRPTLATNMVLAGATLFQVKMALGHESVQTTAGYLDSHGLRPAFNRTVSEALQRIAERSKQRKTETPPTNAAPSFATTPEPPAFHETLSGCGCCDPYNPSENVRSATNHIQGTVCANWNMCLRCDSAIVTEASLPKLVLYRKRVKRALEIDSPAIKSRKELYNDAVALIDGILEPDSIFPASTIARAEAQSTTMDDMLVDHLIYQGMSHAHRASPSR